MDFFDYEFLLLHDYLQKCEQALAALTNLHQRKQCHLDLEPGKLLMNKDGMVTLVHPGLISQALKKNPATKIMMTRYTAPELENKLHVPSLASDIYSMGEIFAKIFELPSGHLSYVFHPFVKKRYFDLCVKMKNPNPTKRPDVFNVQTQMTHLVVLSYFLDYQDYLFELNTQHPLYQFCLQQLPAILNSLPMLLEYVLDFKPCNRPIFIKLLERQHLEKLLKEDAAAANYLDGYLHYKEPEKAIYDSTALTKVLPCWPKTARLAFLYELKNLKVIIQNPYIRDWVLALLPLSDQKSLRDRLRCAPINHFRHFTPSPKLVTKPTENPVTQPPTDLKSTMKYPT